MTFLSRLKVTYRYVYQSPFPRGGSKEFLASSNKYSKFKENKYRLPFRRWYNILKSNSTNSYDYDNTNSSLNQVRLSEDYATPCFMPKIQFRTRIMHAVYGVVLPNIARILIFRPCSIRTCIVNDRRWELRT